MVGWRQREQQRLGKQSQQEKIRGLSTKTSEGDKEERVDVRDEGRMVRIQAQIGYVCILWGEMIN